MLNFKTYFVDRIKADTTMQGFLKDANNNMRLYPAGVDLLPEQLPCITYSEVGTTILSVPRGMRIGKLQVDIWSSNSQLEVDQIHQQLGILFNFRDSTQDTFTGTLWWVREDNVVSGLTTDRRVWRKTVDLKVWFTNSNAL